MNTKEQSTGVIHKALDILLMFRREQSITIDDMSKRLDLPKSSVYRYVRALVERGFLQKSTKSEYRLGLIFLQLSYSALDGHENLRLTALPSMQRLAVHTGESVALMRLHDRKAICIEYIEGQYPLRMMMEPGYAQPLHASAPGKVLVAHLPEELWDASLEMPLRSYGKNTITDLKRLRSELRKVRDKGFAVSDGELHVGARSVAVPIYGAKGAVIATMSIEAPAMRMEDHLLPNYVGALQDEARIIRNALN